MVVKIVFINSLYHAKITMEQLVICLLNVITFFPGELGEDGGGCMHNILTAYTT